MADAPNIPLMGDNQKRMLKLLENVGETVKDLDRGGRDAFKRTQRSAAEGWGANFAEQDAADRAKVIAQETAKAEQKAAERRAVTYRDEEILELWGRPVVGKYLEQAGRTREQGVPEGVSLDPVGISPDMQNRLKDILKEQGAERHRDTLRGRREDPDSPWYDPRSWFGDANPVDFFIPAAAADDSLFYTQAEIERASEELEEFWQEGTDEAAADAVAKQVERHVSQPREPTGEGDDTPLLHRKEAGEDGPLTLMNQSADIVRWAAAGLADEAVELVRDGASTLTGGWIEQRDIRAFRSLANEPGEVGKVASAILQFGIPFGSGMKIVQARKLLDGRAWGKTQHTAAGAGVGALVGFGAFDPYQERLGMMMDEVPWLSWVPKWIRSNDPDDSKWYLRVKNAAEEAGLGALGDGAYQIIRRGVHAMKGGKGEAGVPPGEMTEEARKAAIESRDATWAAAWREAHENVDRDPTFDELWGWRAERDTAKAFGGTQSHTFNRLVLTGFGDEGEDIVFDFVNPWAANLTEGISTPNVAPLKSAIEKLRKDEQLVRVQRSGFDDPPGEIESRMDLQLTAEEDAALRELADKHNREVAVGKRVGGEQQAAGETADSTREAAARDMTEAEAEGIGPMLRRRFPGISDDTVTRWTELHDLLEKGIQQDDFPWQKLNESINNTPDMSPAGLGQVLAHLAIKQQDGAQTERLLDLTRVLANEGRLEPRDTRDILVAMHRRLVQLNDAVAAELTAQGVPHQSDAARHVSQRFHAADQALKNFNSAVDEPLGERYDAAMAAMADLIDNEVYAGLFGTRLSNALTRSLPHAGQANKQFVTEAPETVEETLRRDPSDFGAFPGDALWQASTPERWADLPMERAILGGVRRERPAVIHFGEVNEPRDIEVLLDNHFAPRHPRSDIVSPGVGAEGAAARHSADVTHEARERAAHSSLRRYLDETTTFEPGRPQSVAQRGAPAALDMMLTAGQTVYRLARMSATSPDAKRLFLKSLYTHEAMARHIVGDKKGAAELMKRAQDVAGEEYGALIERHGGREHVDALATAFAEAQSLEHMGRMQRDWLRPDRLGEGGKVKMFMRSIQSLRLGSMLTSPFTHSVNIAAGMVPPLLDLPEQMLSSALIHGSIADRKVLEDVSARVFGSARGVVMGLQMVGRDLAIRQGPLRYVDKMNQGLKRNGHEKIRRDFSRVSKPERALLIGEDGGARSLNQKHSHWSLANFNRWVQTSRVPNVSFDLLGAEDMFFKSISYMAETHYQALQRVRAAQPQLKGRALRKAVADEVQRHSVGAGPDHAKALEHSEFNTFTNDLDAFGQQVQMALNMGGQAGRWVSPFPRTMMNLFKYGLKGTPASVLLRSTKDNLLAGGEARSKEIARMTLGTAFAAAAAPGVFGGYITGSGGANPYMQRPEPKNSFRVGEGDWHRYMDIPRVGPILSILSGMVEIMAAAETEEEINIASGTFSVGAALVGTALDSQWAGDFGEFLDAVTVASTGDPDRLLRFIGKQAGSVIPFAAGRSSAAQVLDDGMREDTRVGGGAMRNDEAFTEKVMEAWQEATKRAFPLIRALSHAERYPRRGLYGKPLTRVAPPDVNVAGMQISMPKVFLAHMAPTAWIASANDPLSREITRLEMGMNWTKRDAVWTRYGQSHGVELTPEQYDYASKRRGELFFKLGTRMVNSMHFSRASDSERRAFIRGTMAQATTAMRHELSRRFPALEVEERDFYSRALLSVMR